MHCTGCGAQISDNSVFCQNCGQSATAARAAAQPTPSGTAAVPQAQATALQSNMAGMLCYIGGFITGIFFLVADPYKRDPFVRFHAFQSIFVSVVWIGIHFVLSMLLSALPWSLWSTITLLSELVSLGCFLLFLLLMYKAYSNERFKLPVVGDLAERQV